MATESHAPHSLSAKYTLGSVKDISTLSHYLRDFSPSFSRKPNRKTESHFHLHGFSLLSLATTTTTIFVIAFSVCFRYYSLPLSILLSYFPENVANPRLIESSSFRNV